MFKSSLIEVADYFVIDYSTTQFPLAARSDACLILLQFLRASMQYVSQYPSRRTVSMHCVTLESAALQPLLLN